jgi:hypothetical protein
MPISATGTGGALGAVPVDVFGAAFGSRGGRPRRFVSVAGLSGAAPAALGLAVFAGSGLSKSSGFSAGFVVEVVAGVGDLAAGAGFVSVWGFGAGCCSVIVNGSVNGENERLAGALLDFLDQPIRHFGGAHAIICDDRAVDGESEFHGVLRFSQELV